MTTGDLKNNLRKLISAIKGVEYPGDPDIEALSQGSSEAFLVIYHHAFLDYSRPVAQLIVEKNIDLSGKSDGRFVEGMYKALREIFSFKPALTQSQFFSRAFSEQKIIMGTEILQKIKEKHKRLGPKPKPRDPALLRKTVNFVILNSFKKTSFFFGIVFQNSTSSSRPVSAPVKMVDELDHMISTAVTNEKKKVALTSPVTQKVISPIMELSREKKVTFRDKSQDHVEIVYDTGAFPSPSLEVSFYSRFKFSFFVSNTFA
ncbi:hypothetical protein CAPTEDRAFT_125185 [Capitella teleta]|uniref:Centrosomal protein of 44 kDa n=1 Tax=Capitella teleta TaxID=283909 RepID=R7TIM8_CAPTE|nr:hypothetical protein CAPTEDRAFT_125185 [Capitella teleta]|eukprot:ELT93312.1 hypothetical protein CAPTEDRAFT_125185 [Capitella teleta]